MVEKIVITGGPCTGKTSVIRKLKEMGYDVLPEVARSFIQSEKRAAARDPNYIPLLPNLDDNIIFQEVLAWKQEVSESRVRVNTKRVFLDRSLVDIVSYFTNEEVFGDDRDPRVLKAGYAHIFLLEPVPYRTDSERRETKKEARRMHNVLQDLYIRYGFSPIDVPAASSRWRADFILNKLKGGV